MKTFSISSMESDGPISSSTNIGQGLLNFAVVEKKWKFDILPGYYLTKAEMNNLILYPSDMYLSPLLVSDDLGNSWVPVEQAIGQPFNNTVLYLKTTQMDPVIVQAITSKFAASVYDLDAYVTSASEVILESASMDEVGFQYFTLEFASQPVTYANPVTEKQNILLNSHLSTPIQVVNVAGGAVLSTFLMGLPWWRRVAFQVAAKEVGNLTSYKLWVVRFQLDSLYDTVDQEIVAYYDSADLGKTVYLTGVTDGNKGTQGLMLVVQALASGGAASAALLDLYLSATKAEDQPYLMPTPNRGAYTLPATA